MRRNQRNGGANEARTLLLALLLSFGVLVSLTAAQDKGAAEGGVVDKAKEVEGAAKVKAKVKPLEPPTLLSGLGFQLKPYGVDAKKKANLSIDAAIGQLKAPGYLRPRIPKPGPRVDPKPKANEGGREVTASIALKTYVRGLDAYRNGRRFEAINWLERARRLDPKSAAVARLLGMVYFDAHNEIKGAQRLSEAVRLDSDDAVSLFLLGRFAYNKRKWEEAAVTIAASGKAKGTSNRQIEVLRPYYLGQSLLTLKYDRAAIGQLTTFLGLEPRLARTTRLFNEVAYVIRQRGRVCATVGDAYCRLGEYKAALAMYEKAAGDRYVDSALLTARRIYALFALGRYSDGEKVLVAQLNGEKFGNRLLGLVSYAAAYTDGRERFGTLLQDVYKSKNRPAALALALARMLRGKQATAFLLDHLAAQPRDTIVYEHVVEQLAKNDTEALTHTVLSMIKSRPDRASRYVDRMIKEVSDGHVLRGHLDKLEEPLKSSASAWYLRGRLLQLDGETGNAIKAYEAALKADGKFRTPLMTMIELRLGLGQASEAEKLLKQFDRDTSARIQFYRVKVKALQGDHGAALVLLNQLLAAQPRNVEYRLYKADMYLGRKDYENARRTLNAVLDVDPINEAAFERLFQVVRADHRADETELLELLRRVNRVAPNSRVARFYTAEAFVGAKRYASAERVLTRLVTENPDDNESIRLLVYVFVKSKRMQKAEEVLTGLIKLRPYSEVIAGSLEAVSEELGKVDEYRENREKALLGGEGTLRNKQALYDLYVGWQKWKEAAKAIEAIFKMDPSRYGQWDWVRRKVAVHMRAEQWDRGVDAIDQALKLNPAKEDKLKLLYQKSNIHTLKDKRKDAEATLLEILKVDEKHAGANNDLAYMWAEDGRNLDRALKMSHLAVKAEEKNYAYLDTLGWVYYKRGEFDRAIRQLNRAYATGKGREDAVILDHLGDAYWQADRKPLAISYWKRAIRLAEQADKTDRPDLVDLLKTLNGKVKAYEAKKEPSVAPLGKKEKDGGGEGDGEAKPE